MWNQASERKEVKTPLTIVITVTVTAGWQVLASLAALTAANLGYKLLRKTGKVVEQDTTNEIEITDENSQIIEETLKPEEEMVFTKDDITLTLKKDVRDKFTICARSEKRTEKELRQIGKLFLNKIKQQYAYQKVKDEMSRRGFNIVQEETMQNKIKIVLRRF